MNPSWKISSKLELRETFSEGEDHEVENEIRYNRSDITVILNRKIFSRSTIGAGYLLRYQNDEFIHRSIQQFTLTGSKPRIHFVHRFVFDQTYRQAKPTQFRFRYRLLGELALKEETIDPGECYFKFHHEYLPSITGGEGNLEIRTLGALGFLLPSKNKLEVGVEYRVDGFFNHDTQHTVWLFLGSYFNL